MCAAKSPISALQELLVIRHLSLPQYEIISQGSGFMCTGKTGNISVSAVAESKKRAKHLCAEHILVELQSQQLIVPHSNNLTVIHSVHVPILPQVAKIYDTKAKEPIFNAIGKLNEFCSQNGMLYPNYEEAGIKDQKFVIICKLGNHITQGQSSTKKHAKQIAAGEMLSRVSLMDLNSAGQKFNLEQTKVKQTHHADIEKEVTLLWKKQKTKVQDQSLERQTTANVLLNLETKGLNINGKKLGTIEQDEVQEKIIQLFKNLSYKAQNESLKVQTNLLPQTRRDTLLNHQIKNLNTGKAEQQIGEKEHFTKEQLQKELQQLNVKYKITEFQKNPLVLTLQTLPTEKHPQYTFMHYADTYPLAILGLLEKAVHDIKILKT